MNSLYNEYYVTELGREIQDVVETFINELLEEYPNVNLIELNDLVIHTISTEITVAKYTYSSKQRKLRKNNVNATI